jgi:hypothetical protein
MKKLLIATIAAFSLAAATLPADAKGGVKVGTLACQVKPGVGLLIGSNKDMSCKFSGVNGEHASYKGNIAKFGIDVGFTNGTTILWGVFAPAWQNAHALDGTYVGASAEATVGAGLGANVLVGGLRKSIALQPISVQGQTGLDASLALASVTLHSK